MNNRSQEELEAAATDHQLLTNFFLGEGNHYFDSAKESESVAMMAIRVIKQLEAELRKYHQ